MLLWVMAPLLIAGVVVCWQRRREPLVRFLVAGICLHRSQRHSPTTGRHTRCDRRGCCRSSSSSPCSAPTGSAGCAGRTRRLAIAGHRRRARRRPARAGGLLHRRPLHRLPEPRRPVLRHRRDRRDHHRAQTSPARTGSTCPTTLDQPYIEAFFATCRPRRRTRGRPTTPPGLTALGMEVIAARLRLTTSHPAHRRHARAEPVRPAPPSGWALVASERGPANPLDAVGAAAGARERLPLRRLTLVPLLRLAPAPGQIRWNHD